MTHLRQQREPRWLKPLLLTLMLVFLLLFLGLPLITVFVNALHQGLLAWAAAVTDADVLASIKLTLIIAAISVPLNTVIGILLAWAIARHEFFGKSIFTTLIELPFSVSPVIAGLMFVLLFSGEGWLATAVEASGFPILFALPGMVLATLFVTFPFVARTLIPLLESLGHDDEEAAMTLGACPWQTFWRVTLPNIKWGLLYGIILTNARAIGEFGAVSVVSGSIRGLTTTLPLTIGILFDEYAFNAAFAVASLLTLLALITLFVKTISERLLHQSS